MGCLLLIIAMLIWHQHPLAAVILIIAAFLSGGNSPNIGVRR